MADLGLPDKEIKHVMMEADMDDNGEISYEEFIPLAVELVHTMYAKMEAEQQAAQTEEEAREEAKHFLLHGLTKEEVEAIMADIFRKADADGSGALSVTEFHKCCKDADIGLTRKEVNALMAMCDVDGDGQITYDEFVPLCFDMLVEIMKDDLMSSKRDANELTVYLKDVWSGLDPAGEGVLAPPALKTGLRDADLGLTKLQIHSVLAEAEYDEFGMANYAKFAGKAADLIYRMLDMDAQLERADQVSSLLAGGTDFESINGFSQGEIEQMLTQALTQAAGGGETLPMNQLAALLQSLPLGLDRMQVNSLISAVDTDSNGNAYFDPLISYAFHILQYMAQDSAING